MCWMTQMNFKWWSVSHISLSLWLTFIIYYLTNIIVTLFVGVPDAIGSPLLSKFDYISRYIDFLLVWYRWYDDQFLNLIIDFLIFFTNSSKVTGKVALPFVKLLFSSLSYFSWNKQQKRQLPFSFSTFSCKPNNITNFTIFSFLNSLFFFPFSLICQSMC